MSGNWELVNANFQGADVKHQAQLTNDIAVKPVKWCNAHLLGGCLFGKNEVEMLEWGKLLWLPVVVGFLTLSGCAPGKSVWHRAAYEPVEPNFRGRQVYTPKTTVSPYHQDQDQDQDTLDLPRRLDLNSNSSQSAETIGNSGAR